MKTVAGGHAAVRHACCSVPGMNSRNVNDPHEPPDPRRNEGPIREVQTINPQQPQGAPHEERLFEQIQRNEQRPPPKRDIPERSYADE